MKAWQLATVIMAFSVSARASSIDTLQELPSETTAKIVLNSTPRHREWVNVAVGSKAVLAFIVYPERADKAPVIMVTEKNDGATTWIRAVSDQIAAEGFIAVVPELLTGLGPQGGDADSFRGRRAASQALSKLGSHEIQRRIDAVRAYATALPAATGESADIELDRAAGRITTGRATFALNAKGWHEALAYLNAQTINHPVFAANPYQGEHAEHYAMMAMARQARQATPRSTAIQIALGDKRPDLPAHIYTAKSTLANSKLRKEWVEVPVGDVKLRMWVEYPEGNGKTGVVIVMQHGTGLDDWMRSVADQIAHEGYIAVAPDIWSGTGSNGGGRDSFQFDDDAMKAAARIGPAETMRRYKAAWEWAMKLPRANGKSGTIGFCAGGGNSFLFASEVPELSAAVVFYGTPPPEEIMARIKAPVLGFYGENDARVTSTVEPTIAAMKRLGKSFEPHVYPKTTHSFVLFQDIAANQEALKDAWPRAMVFFKQNLK
jgi:carboxymethylenebutenolidase